MNPFFQTTVSYKGQELQGLCLPSSVQRLSSSIAIPDGFVSVGKQRFSDGLRICFIQEHLINKVVPRTLKPGEYAISGYTTNLEIQETIYHACNVVKECFLKDPSDNHKIWMLRTLQNNMGLNSWCNIASDILALNWNDNPVFFVDFEPYYNERKNLKA